MRLHLLCRRALHLLLLTPLRCCALRLCGFVLPHCPLHHLRVALPLLLLLSLRLGGVLHPPRTSAVQPQHTKCAKAA